MSFTPMIRCKFTVLAVVWLVLGGSCGPSKTIGPDPQTPLNSDPKQTSQSDSFDPESLHHPYKPIELVMGEPEIGDPLADLTVEDKLIRPEDYRQWVHVGTRLAPSDGKPDTLRTQYHNVFVHPEAFAQYRETGNFLNNALIVREIVTVKKDVRKVETDTEGPVAGDFVALDVSVKDAVRFKGQPGNWAYFHFSDQDPMAEPAAVQKADQCSDCHKSQAADTDFVFVKYYPTLRDRKMSPSGDGKGLVSSQTLNKSGKTPADGDSQPQSKMWIWMVVLGLVVMLAVIVTFVKIKRKINSK